MMLRTGFLAIIALAAAATLPAKAQPRDTLTIGMAQFPPDMHPYITNTSIKEYVANTARRNMTGFNRDGTVICLICTEVPSLANGRAKVVTRPDGSQGMEVRFTLQPGLTWADGTPVKASDVAFSFQVSQAFSPSPTVDRVEAPTAHDVLIHLKRVRYDFDRSAFQPLPEHIEGPIFRAAATPLEYGQKSAYNRRPDEPGLWFGPYRIAAFKPNESVTLLPNPHWKGTAPRFKQVNMRLIENTSALQANLLAGDVDLVAPGNLGLTLDQVVAMSKTQAARFDFAFIPSVTAYEHLALNLDNPLLADRRVRQAMAMAVDRKTLVARLFENKQDIADSFKHPTQFGWDDSVKRWPYDPKAARALLADAGFKPGPDGILLNAAGERLSIDLVTTAGNRMRELVQQVLQTQYKAIGIEMVVKTEPARLMFGETLRKRSYRGAVMFMSDPPMDNVPIYVFHSDWIPRAENNWTGQNYMGWRNPAMDTALDAAWAELDPVRRKALWKSILDITAEEVPEVNLFFGAQTNTTPKWLTGVAEPTRFGSPTIWIENWRPR